MGKVAAHEASITTRRRNPRSREAQERIRMAIERERENELQAAKLIAAVPNHIVEKVTGGYYFDSNMSVLAFLAKDKDALPYLRKAKAKMLKRNPGRPYHRGRASKVEAALAKPQSDESRAYREGQLDEARLSARRSAGMRNPSLSAADKKKALKIKGVKPEMLGDPRFVQALAKYKEFHGCWPKTLEAREMGVGNPGDCDFFVNAGKAETMNYRPTKGQKGSNKYGSAWVHEYGEGKGKITDKDRPDVLISGDGKTIVHHGGSFKVKDWVRH